MAAARRRQCAPARASRAKHAARSHLRHRSAGQPGAALPARRRPAPDHPGPFAFAEDLEDRLMYPKLVFGTLCLTLVVVVVGAYVRLQDAGLGCPDWPGCYGHWVGVPEHAHEIERAGQAFPGKPVEAGKA